MKTMIRRIRPLLGAAAVLAVVLPEATAAQEPMTVGAQQVQDLETMKSKFVSLAQAFDESHMDWRPMDGTRSVKDVVALMVAEVHLFPTLWGFDAPSHAAEGFGQEIARVSALDSDAAIAEMERGFDFMIESVASIEEGRLNEPSDWFGTPMVLGASIAAAIGDMHEHLGQLIAYARSNEVVPPWSQSSG